MLSKTVHFENNSTLKDPENFLAMFSDNKIKYKHK